jgi:23S rRNA pseudouridine1911/1915/1917 synthase
VSQKSPKIILEDKYLLVLDKPSGWTVNNAETTKGQSTIQDWLAANFNFEISQSREFRSGIVHRLDRETSGLLLVAKAKGVFEDLQRQFKKRQVKKTYLALVHGKFEERRGVVFARLGRLPWDRKKFGVVPGGKAAETRFSVKTEFHLAKDAFSLVEVYPKTGRTHQIRVHMKHVGHPVVSDSKYAGRKTSRRDHKWCPRMFLHAAGLVFTHPISRKRASVNSPLPSELENALSTLTKRDTLN